MQLVGHEGEINSAKFSPNGTTLASASFDRQILLWNVYGDCENFCVMTGHTGAILELCFSRDGSMVFTASTDKTGSVWDCSAGQRMKKLRGHTSFVNSCAASRRGVQLVATGSDDGTIKVWDIRQRNATATLNNTFQITTVAFNDTSDQLFSAGIDNDIKAWDLRQNAMLHTMKGHSDTVTGLSLSPNGYYLLSNCMDNTVRVWDVRPFAPTDRQLKVFQGHQHNFEKNLLRCAWSPDGRRIAAGSSDRSVYVWDTVFQRLMYKLPGHLGSVNDVHFHPKEPIILSCSSDKTLYLGELV
jgi:Prp8 binding protein